jgi:hypothetical protein
LPPKATPRNTGPELISAAASHACTASTGRSRYRDLLPLPFLIALAAPDQDPQPVGDFGEIGDLERAEFTAPERPGKAQAKQRAIPLADHAVRAQGNHLADQVRGRRRLALFRAADGRRIPRSTAFTASLPVGGSWPAILWWQPIAAALRPMVLALRPLSARLER